MFMKIKCLACHEFRVSRRQCKVFVAKLHLIDIGKMNEALDLDRELAVLTQKAGEGKMEGKSNHRQARMETISETATKIDQLLDQKLAMVGDEEHAVLTMHERAARRKVLKDFQTECTKSPKCHNCNAFSPKIRHDQFNKIFQQPLSAKSKKSNLGERVKIRPALANGINGTGQGGYDSEDEVMDDVEDSEDEFHDARSHMIDDEAVEDGADKRKKKKAKKNKDDEEEEIDPTGGGISRKANVSATKTKDDPAKQDKFMHALEVEAQCRLTWEKQPSLCTKFFGSAHSPEGNTSTSTYESSYAQLDTTANGGGNRPRSTSNAAEQVSGGGNGYTLFFMRTIPVPPSRFRPPVVMGNMTVEHSQNYYLSKVLELNARLRSGFATSHELAQEEAELQRSLSSNNGDNGGATPIASQLKKIQDDKDKTQANSLGVWVDLQTTVNCFMDSSRDPSGNTGNAPNGIRQLLEKKEGIFRKHMMGKRVNYACRSVISPDPYIGTNEIGLPLYFAKTLTFPTPVTPLNIADMQNLVRRGPSQYPGAVWVEFPNGQRVDLSKMKERSRNAIAARLLSENGVIKVGRQLRDGDMVLMNRQVSTV
jgi:DNA-directed RNA polymerase I subunit RPA1